MNVIKDVPRERMVPTMKNKAEIHNTAKEETQRLLKAVQHERDRLLALVNSIADEVSFADTEKEFTLANPSALRGFGFAFTDEIDVEKLAESHPQVKAALESIFPVLQEAIQEARRIPMALRPPLLDDIGILPTINWFCRQFQATSSHIRIKQEINIKESEVPDSLKTVIFRVLQEAMNNIAKHSKADRVNLSLRKMDGVIELGIQDNGQGFNPGEARFRAGTTRGLGLDSMKERTELSGGSFSIESSKGTGTVIRATWPIKQLCP